MPCAKHCDIPLDFIVDFEKQFDFASAGHSDIGLQVPGNKLAGGTGCGLHGFLRVIDCGCFNFAAANGAPFETICRDQSFRSHDLGGAAPDVDQRDGSERCIKFRQLAEFSAMLDDIECHQNDTFLLGGCVDSLPCAILRDSTCCRKKSTDGRTKTSPALEAGDGH